jgi:tRNA nucleotidyltransferase (CCA-adding enzyme)
VPAITGAAPAWAIALPQRGHLLAALAAVRGVDAGAIARGLADKARIPEAVHEARVAALKALG